MAALLAQRTEVLGLLTGMRAEYEGTATKVAAAALELEAVGFELEELRQQVEGERTGLGQVQQRVASEQAKLDAVRQERLREEQLLAQVVANKEAQLKQLDQQMREWEAMMGAMQARMASGGGMHPDASQQPQSPGPSGYGAGDQQDGDVGTGQELTPSLASASKPRMRRRVKRQAIRRSVSCSDMAALVTHPQVLPPPGTSSTPPGKTQQQHQQQGCSRPDTHDQNIGDGSNTCGGAASKGPMPTSACAACAHGSTQTEDVGDCILCSCLRDRLASGQKQTAALQAQLSQVRHTGLRCRTLHHILYPCKVIVLF